MKTNLAIATRHASARFLPLFPGLGVTAFLQLGTLQTIHAGSATRDANPPTTEWTSPNNWTPATVPNGPLDVATFDSSQKTSISVNSSITLSGMTFNAGARPYTISVFFTTDGVTSFDFTGSGVLSNSTAEETISLNGASMTLSNSATIDSPNFPGFVAITVESLGLNSVPSALNFSGQANAAPHGATTITNLITPGSIWVVQTTFSGSASAGSAKIINDGGDARGTNTYGLTVFSENSTAGDAFITSSAGIFPGNLPGETDFIDTASAGAAILSGTGLYKFLDDSAQAMGRSRAL